jgi:hypothetical protein
MKKVLAFIPFLLCFASCASRTSGVSVLSNSAHQSAVIAAQNSPISFWRYLPQQDSVTDKDRSAIVNNGYKSIFIIYCNDSELVMYLDTSIYMSRDLARVIYRFDNEPASISADWRTGASGTTVFVPKLSSQRFIQKALNAKKAIFRVTDFRGQNFDFTFEAWEGLNISIKNLKCATNQ